MSKIHIKTTINSDLDGMSYLNTDGEYDDERKVIFYKDGNTDVSVTLDKNIIIKRNSDEYELELIFDEKEESLSTYKIYEPEMILELKVNTTFIKINQNNFYIEYVLYVNNEQSGTFNIKFEWED
jgi:uncharacterized beta-barrel protein YwiB (DUF1934 family)